MRISLKEFIILASYCFFLMADMVRILTTGIAQVSRFDKYSNAVRFAAFPLLLERNLICLCGVCGGRNVHSVVIMSGYCTEIYSSLPTSANMQT
jgi:hypothetical protein